ncbi:hypothetical protein SDRG_01690 [Saprolegnia diclina VS20]|uniref:Uncharacterized protein n=1 Tax=Saprolegnia diclina (strain VS20) TaxID=1156394 RepID=T0R5P5_SAPDV|nr:hypothetical protein SDRG_01690 [Saprolegnia diclina VS20]EQC41735.1 hypothetical protein SDRG_01690 [Saprolegnia diclina VS20]|eukprot:XP_008605449.1 hypothetical protein SDRG_01690 [Saprolegnia diclina VS20]
MVAKMLRCAVQPRATPSSAGGSNMATMTITNGAAASGRLHDQSQASYLAAYARVGSNLVAGCLILLSLLTLSVLGMFDRLVVSVNAQTETYFWAPFGQSCLLTASGFVPESCSADEVNATSLTVWTAVGHILAQQWARELEASPTLRVTTCIIGGTSSVGWANLQLVAGYDAFPECLPTNGAQPVAGMAMLETTIREAFVEGVYLMTLYSDLDPAMNTVHLHVSSDGSKAKLMKDPARTIITQDGVALADAFGTDYIINSYPLGPWFHVVGYCHTEIEEVSDLGLPGWSQGKSSGHAICPGWNCGHQVENATALIALQLCLSVLTLALLGGDIYVTWQGLRGLLRHKPVLTYALLSGLERRKVLLSFIALNAAPSLLYLDVSRIYFFTTNGFKIWSLSAAMLGNCVAFGCLFILSLVGMLPAPRIIQDYCISYSAPAFLFCTIGGVAFKLCDMDLFRLVYNQFYAAPPYLGMYVNQATWPSGAYVAEGTPAVATLLSSLVAYPILIALGASMLLSMGHRRLRSRGLLLHTQWCTANSFLRYAKRPQYITSLPLEESNAIKIGAKLFCKPSTMALMGYGIVAEAEADPTPDAAMKRPQTTFVLVSIYALLPALLRSGWRMPVLIAGVIRGNQFEPTKGKTTLDRTREYVHKRGSCVT